MPLQATSGAASYDAFGGGVAAVPNYIEEVFSSYLWTGNGTTQTITNGIDLSGKGGMVWRKRRDAAADHFIADTVRGTYSTLSSNTTAAASGSSYIDFLSDGFQAVNSGGSNPSGSLQVGWTFRKSPKFFDVVTYTGNGSVQNIAHNLGSAPGCMIIKPVSASGAWPVYHRSINIDYPLYLNTTAAATGPNTIFGIAPTSTQFTVWVSNETNQSGVQYVAYLFAHDAGGFGLTGTDNVISCGSSVGGGSAGDVTVNLGYEPQWVLLKRTDSATVGGWELIDNMRGWPDSSAGENYLLANTSAAEATGGYWTGHPTATGFTHYAYAGATYIYIAIRRGPMAVPTDGTKVFSPFTTTASTGTAVTTNFPVDFQLYKYRAGVDYWFDVDRLRGVNSTTTANSTPWLDTTATTAEATATNVSRNWGNTGFEVPGIVGGASNVFYSFQRAPGFFDEVCYTGTGSAMTVAHNLGVVPELMIVKERSSPAGWWWNVYYGTANKFLKLNTTDAETTSTAVWNNTAPTSSVFSVGAYTPSNTSGSTYVAYLFATCPGVSKVGTYTGDNTDNRIIDCGFTSGARFILIKRTDQGGQWAVWDSARGITSGNDPYLILNLTVAEITGFNDVDTHATGFKVNASSPGIPVNVAGATYIFLAIA